ncbi:MAG: hypothetical protein R2712_08215 [Vicinamibacterales bacterium]
MTHQQAIDKHAAERYLLDEMAELERYDFEAHYFECDACADSVMTGARMADGIQAGLLPGAASAVTTPRPLVQAPAAASAPAQVVSMPGRTWLPWAVAAMLAIGLGYQTLQVVPDRGAQLAGPQVVAPVALRAATRGPDVTVSRPDSGVLSFALDLAGVSDGARLAYDLRTADGTSVASGTAAAPSPGTPLLLLVPSSAVSTPGSFTLSIRAVDEPASLPVDYRFTITER